MKELIDIALKYVDSVELFSLTSNSRSVSFGNNKLKGTSVTQNRGIGVRIIKDGKIVQASTSNLQEFPEFIKKLAELAKYGDKAVFDFAGKSDLSNNLNLYNPEIEELPLEDFISMGEKVLKKLQKEVPGILAYFGVSTETTEVEIVTSNGFENSYKKSVYYLGVGGQLVEGKNIIYTGEPFAAYRPITEDELQEKIERTIEYISLAKNTVQIKSGPTKVIITPKAMADIFISFEEGLNGANVMKRTSPLVGKLNQKILNEKIKILDDPLNIEGVGATPFDDEGSPSFKKYIIENGVLKNYLTDRKSSTILGVKNSANGFRVKALLRNKDYASNVAPDISNLVVEGGMRSYKKMIEDIDEGLLIDIITGILLGNLINGDFSGNIFLGFLIKNGKLVGRVKNTMIAGNFYDAFGEKFVEFSKEREWVGNFGGTSGSYLLPYTLWKDINIESQ